MSHLLEVNDLKTYFSKDGRIARAVDGISFTVDSGEILGIVGESGSGKTVTGLSVLKLIPENLGKIVEGKILFQGSNLLERPADEMQSIRGNKISMIFQDPLSSLNPVFTCGDQINEVVRYHEKSGRSTAKEKTLRMLKMAGIPDPEQCYRSYPHQLSGGLRQRVMIAMALVCEPDLLIADEPTTALDVTVQAQILDLLKDLQQRLGMSVLFISHDLGVISQIADRILVMYAGQIVEYGTTDDIFENPLHPYTVGLLESIPSFYSERQNLRSIPGTAPEASNFPSGCRFHPRCLINDKDDCVKVIPEFYRESVWKHTGRCHYIEESGHRLRSPINYEQK